MCNLWCGHSAPLYGMWFAAINIAKRFLSLRRGDVYYIFSWDLNIGGSYNENVFSSTNLFMHTHSHTHTRTRGHHSRAQNVLRVQAVYVLNEIHSWISIICGHIIHNSFTFMTNSNGYLYTLTGDWYFCTIVWLFVFLFGRLLWTQYPYKLIRLFVVSHFALLLRKNGHQHFCVCLQLFFWWFSSIFDEMMYKNLTKTIDSCTFCEWNNAK